MSALIGLTGDLMCHAGFVVQEGEGMPFAEHFSPELTALCQSHDELWGNLEGPVLPAANGMQVWERARRLRRECPKLFFLEQYLPQLWRMGFRVLGVANNHAFDFETQDDTLVTAETLGRHGFVTVGCDFKPVFRQVNDISFAIFAITTFLNPPYISGSIALLTDSTVDVFCAEIERCKRDVDYVVVLAHWGWDYVLQPTTKVKQLAEKLFSAGAKIIYGNHPHILWPIQQPSHDRILIYSLGNFSQVFGVSPGHKNYHLFRQALHSGILSLLITREGITPTFQRTFVWQTFEAWLGDIPARKSFWFWTDADVENWCATRSRLPNRLRSVICPFGSSREGCLSEYEIDNIVGRIR